MFLKLGRPRLNLNDQRSNHRGPINHLGDLVENVDHFHGRLTVEGIPTRCIPVDPTMCTHYCMVKGSDGMLIEIGGPAAGMTTTLSASRPHRLGIRVTEVIRAFSRGDLVVIVDVAERET
jgi:hypothetical protein